MGKCSTDFAKLMSSFYCKSVSPLPYNLGSPYLVNTLMMEGTCPSLSICHLSRISFSW